MADADAIAVYGGGPLFVCSLEEELPLFIPPSATGVAAAPARTLPQMLHTTAARCADLRAVSWRVPDDAPPSGGGGAPSFYRHLAAKADGSHWESMSWRELEVECSTFGAACLA